ncbi:hypothetical protein HYR69_01615 [Candidatus Sumerlaeota bacterium]|nr:hypothetical protein [Candidatus Sumerlaeota bacterium]MBI3736738.1 hypothetical protein [Candidatus Sumerlaeota bacterium]
MEIMVLHGAAGLDRQDNVIFPAREQKGEPARGREACAEKPLLALAIPEGRSGPLLAALGPMLLAGEKVYCLDGGNIFNPYRLALWLRQRGCAPEPILAERLFVSRAFTCHQLAGAVETLLAPLAAEADPPAALILGIEQLFLDEDIPFFERRYLFERILSSARTLRRRGLPMLITCGAKEGNYWVGRLRRSASFLTDSAQAAAGIRRIADGTDAADLQHMA